MTRHYSSGGGDDGGDGGGDVVVVAATAVVDDVACCLRVKYLLSYVVGVKDRSNTQPRVKSLQHSPPI